MSDQQTFFGVGGSNRNFNLTVLRIYIAFKIPKPTQYCHLAGQWKGHLGFFS